MAGSILDEILRQRQAHQAQANANAYAGSVFGQGAGFAHASEDYLNRLYGAAGSGFAAPPTVAPRKRTAFDVLYIAENAPLEVAEAAYRALAKKAHPDAGGSEKQMQDLNAAIAHVRKVRA